MTSDVLYRYLPKDDQFVYGVPQRDLTAKDVDRIDPVALRNGVDAGLYKAVKATGPSATSKPAEAEGEVK